MNIIKILEQKEGFSSTEESLADFILKNKDLITNMLIKELSELSYVSSSSIVRFCKKIGYDGFPELKVDLAQQLAKNTKEEEVPDPNFPFNKNDSVYEIAKKCLISRQNIMNECYSYFDQTDFIKCRDLMLKARRIVIFARGENYTKALAFQDQLMKINLNVIINNIPMEDDHLAYTLDNRDLAFIITFSGSTEDIIRTTTILNYRRVPIVSITAKIKGFVASSSKICFRIPYHESQSIKFSNYFSQSAIDYILNVLYAVIFVNEYDKNANIRLNSEVFLIKGRRS